MDFTVPVDHRVKLKESKKKDEYLDFARKLKKPWNMKATIIPIVIGALGKVTKGLIQGLEDLEIIGRVETFQTTALLRSARILRRVLEIEETCCHSNSSERPSANADAKNSHGVSSILIVVNQQFILQWLSKAFFYCFSGYFLMLCHIRDFFINIVKYVLTSLTAAATDIVIRCFKLSNSEVLNQGPYKIFFRFNTCKIVNRGSTILFSRSMKKIVLDAFIARDNKVS